MSTPLLAAKLYIPPPGAKAVSRPRLLDQLDAGLHGNLTLISAPAGFGKTTLLAEWVATCELPVAWLSLDEGDSDLARFLTYLVAALQQFGVDIGKGALALLQSPQMPPIDSILTALLNDLSDLSDIADDVVLILDDYHLVDAKAVDDALAFLVKHLPPHLHLTIATREDPPLPLARLRARGRLTEVRVADLRFTDGEATQFLNQAMGLTLSVEDIAALESRTEGWIVGLQLAAISMQGHADQSNSAFIKSFSGSHHFVLDYLLEEVLHQQSENIQAFLLRTSILDQLCGPLCDAVLLDPSTPGQQTLEYFERANLFLVPLDNERRWYRYHHLFADLLQQRLRQSTVSPIEINELHIRASQWYEDNGMEVEAFHHATAANDMDRAERLLEGKGMPLYFRGVVNPVLHWLEGLPASVMDAHPSLWTAYASVLLVTGHTSKVEPTLLAADAALQNAEPTDKNRDLVGRVAAARATAAVGTYQVETIITQSRRALEYLNPNNLAYRTSTVWKLGFAYHFQGDRTAASQAYSEVIAIGQRSGNVVFTLMAIIGLGMIQESENQLPLALETYRNALDLSGDQPIGIACEALLGLARLYYEWNDLAAAEQYVQQSSQLARRIENTDRVVSCDLLLVRLRLAQGDVSGAAHILTQSESFARQRRFVTRMPEIAATQVLVMLRQDNQSAASHLAQAHNLPLSQARIHLAQGDSSAALALLEPLRRQMDAKGWADERLKVMVVQAVAFHVAGKTDEALQTLVEALALAEPGGSIRIFVDEGLPMAQLLSEALAQRISLEYVGKLLAAFESASQLSADQALLEPLSQRELEVLQLIAEGLSNQAIGEKLFLALDTVKGHNRRIFDKLQVQRRTEAVARARELGLL